MRSTQIIAAILIAVFAAAGMSNAVAFKASREAGMRLFKDPKLGTTGKSCDDCHPNGRGADKAAAKADAEIARIVNVCVTRSIKGIALAPDSTEMRSLVLYIKSLRDTVKPVSPGKAPVGC